MSAPELSTGPFSASKKSGTKRENPPCTPYKRKARGKENNPGALGTGLSAGARAGAYAGVCERIRAREARRKREVEAAVEDALTAFHGTRRNPLFDREPRKDRCDERMWANAAWEIGYGKFLDLVDQAKSQIRQKPFAVTTRGQGRTTRPPQSAWRRPGNGATSRTSETNTGESRSRSTFAQRNRRQSPMKGG